MIPGVFRTADTCSRWLCKVDRNYMYIPCWICLCLWSLVSITSCYCGVFFVECQSNADYRKESVKQYTNVNCSEIVAISCIAIFCPHYMLTCWLTLNHFLSDQSGWSIHQCLSSQVPDIIFIGWTLVWWDWSGASCISRWPSPLVRIPPWRPSCRLLSTLRNRTLRSVWRGSVPLPWWCGQSPLVWGLSGWPPGQQVVSCPPAGSRGPRSHARSPWTPYPRRWSRRQRYRCFCIPAFWLDRNHAKMKKKSRTDLILHFKFVKFKLLHFQSRISC